MPYLPKILVTDRDHAEALLVSQAWPLRYLISIGDDVADAPSLSCHPGPHVRLVFHDLNGDDRAGYVGFAPADARRLVDFCALVAQDPGATLIHCAAGISRSTAAALVLIATMMGPGEEAASVESLVDAVTWTWANDLREVQMILPNRRVVALCDQLLGREGRLLAARDEFFG